MCTKLCSTIHTIVCLCNQLASAVFQRDLQEEYYVTHQCFLTNRGLYLLVWNVKDGQPGIESLEIWLQNLQVSGHIQQHIIITVVQVQHLYTVHPETGAQDIMRK